MTFKKLTNWIEQSIRKFKWYDVSLIKLSTFAIALLIAKVYPMILDYDIEAYIVVAVVASAIPIKRMFSK